MPNMTTAQWAILQLGLWIGIIVCNTTLEGWPRVIVSACLFVGCLGSLVERYRNMRRGGGR